MMPGAGGACQENNPGMPFPSRLHGGKGVQHLDLQTTPRKEEG